MKDYAEHENDNNKSLFDAVCEGQLETVQSLLGHEADIEVRRS